MRQRRLHMVVVVDEYGGTSGGEAVPSPLPNVQPLYPSHSFHMMLGGG
jgi:hypothetical protein